MKLTVFGATGGTGVQVVRQALQADHEVTAVVRDPARLPVAHSRLSVVSADVMNPDAITPAVTGSDAVVSALGSRASRAETTTVCADGAGSIAAAMRAAGARRLVVVSNSGMIVDGADGPFTRLVVKPLLQRALANPYADMRRMEDEVRGTDLDWTIVRPPMLTDGPHTGRYRTAADRNLPAGRRISRADLADGILALLDEASSARTATSIAW